MAEKKFQGGPFSGAASASQIEGRIKLNQILSAQLKEVKARSAFLTGVQKTWIATYLHGATGDEPYTGRIGESNNYGVIMCPRWRDVLKAIEDPEQELSQDFDARALLEWADGKRLTLTGEGLAALERLNTTRQANTKTRKTATISKRGPKPKLFLRRSCVNACCEKGLEQSGVEAAFDAYREECNFNARPIPQELEAITDNTIKHDLAWLRDKKNVLPGLQGDNRAEFNAFKKWLKGWTP